MLDGIVVLIEYMMGKMANDRDEIHKRSIGELWERRSGGRCRFGWVVDKDWHELERALSG